MAVGHGNCVGCWIRYAIRICMGYDMNTGVSDIVQYYKTKKRQLRDQALWYHFAL